MTRSMSYLYRALVTACATLSHVGYTVEYSEAIGALLAFENLYSPYNGSVHNTKKELN